MLHKSAKTQEQKNMITQQEHTQNMILGNKIGIKDGKKDGGLKKTNNKGKRYIQENVNRENAIARKEDLMLYKYSSKQ